MGHEIVLYRRSVQYPSSLLRKAITVELVQRFARIARSILINRGEGPHTVSVSDDENLLGPAATRGNIYDWTQVFSAI